MNNKPFYSSKKAFTLIELLVVIAIIGILSGLIIVSMNGATNSAKDAKRKADIDQLRKAVLMYDASNGSYPVQATQCNIGDSSVSGCATLDAALIPAYFATVPTDPSGSYYIYQSASGDFSLNATLSNSTTYTYTASTGFSNASIVGTCGAANNHYRSSAPTGTDACTAGTITGMGSISPYSWTCVASGGTASCSTVAVAYTVVPFTTVGTTTWTVPTGVNQVEVLVVAGGGGGGQDRSGGGGGGGVVYNSAFSVSGSVSVTVGSGGAAANKGGNSIFGTITAIGGGSGAGSASTTNMDGGSGGGGSPYASAGVATSGTGGTSYGNAGGANGSGSSSFTAGGGGGAGGAGMAGSTVSTGAGGAGMAFSITGTSVYYAGGGGGGGWDRSGGSGGSGGGGAGGYNAVGTDGTNGLGGGGGGGGAGSKLGGAGGSGIVIVRYINNN